MLWVTNAEERPTVVVHRGKIHENVGQIVAELLRL